MWLRNDSLVAAVLALLSITLVAFGTWFTLTQRSVCENLFEMCSRSGVGVITVAVVLIAGGLLAYAFNQAERAFVLFHRRPSDDAEAGD